ncbi:MAG: GntR family transcriptional regulator, partial [Bacillati bacterium]
MIAAGACADDDRVHVMLSQVTAPVVRDWDDEIADSRGSRAAPSGGIGGSAGRVQVFAGRIPNRVHPMPKIGWAGILPDLDRDSIVPLYRQIYEQLREGILAGTLPESTRLPPERAMADRLAVNRSTIVRAYRDLVTDGLIEQRVGSGSRVVGQLRSTRTARAGSVPWWVTLPPWRVGEFPMVLGELAAKQEEGRLSFVQGVAPDEPSPLAELAEAFGRVARDPRLVLSYGDSEGYEPLRAAIA